MTTPAERTRSVLGARRLIEILARSSGRFDHNLVRTLAIQLARHFPSNADIGLSSDSLPTIWGSLHEHPSRILSTEVVGRRSKSTKTINVTRDHADEVDLSAASDQMRTR
ncbi:BPSL0761 family protein [Paraburkholderia sp. GAS333]|uniref:BPSL0761 family protein n=1 Tax=Paraburkholderia sp. GAS333 TaxID=3156279 RepID=UPI003D1C76BF